MLDSARVFLDTVTIVLWDLTRAVLVAMVSGSAGALVNFFLDLLGLDGDDLGAAGAVFSVLVTHGSSDLSLVRSVMIV